MNLENDINKNYPRVLHSKLSKESIIYEPWIFYTSVNAYIWFNYLQKWIIPFDKSAFTLYFGHNLKLNPTNFDTYDEIY
jgi:hypothetical protein